MVLLFAAAWEWYSIGSKLLQFPGTGLGFLTPQLGASMLNGAHPCAPSWVSDRRWRVRYRAPERRRTDERGSNQTRCRAVSRECGGFLAAGSIIDLQAARITVGEWDPSWLANKTHAIKPPTSTRSKPPGAFTSRRGGQMPQWVSSDTAASAGPRLLAYEYETFHGTASAGDQSHRHRGRRQRRRGRSGRVRKEQWPRLPRNHADLRALGI